ncbi:MAG TPA: sigma 54-interacting transcriptional regulator [Kofleriaceae bacterium]|jgi:DNA-binding NtrC family response regulator|nr:sigma 54-interacting transcriptional regulator [Kofleriaceae bacterium]
MKILLVFDAPPDVLGRVEDAIILRGHRALKLGTEALDPDSPTMTSADLIVADVELATRLSLVDRVATHTPGTEFVLIGPQSNLSHPDIIEVLARPLDVDRLLAIVDEVADMLDGERFREPVDLVAYETLFAGDSPQIRELLRKLRLVARSDVPVWVFGDDGSGRSIIARAIHDRSARRREPFVAFNCAAHTDEELCRRVFQGDDAAINTARSGSLFIERVGVAGPHTQRELVRYLEARQPDATSTRLIIGMQRDLVANGAQQFISKDLFYRLKVLEIELPSLKERARDLGQIVERMLGRLAAGSKHPIVTSDAMQLLGRYSFPGNLLELAHALTHAYVLARGDAIQPRHLPISIRQATADGDLQRVLEGELEALDVVAKRFERDYLLRVLRSVAGNRGRAAEILGLSRKGLWGKLKAHGISDDVIDGEEELA